MTRHPHQQPGFVVGQRAHGPLRARMGDEPRQRGVDALCDVLSDEQTLDQRKFGRRVHGTHLTQRDRPHRR